MTDRLAEPPQPPAGTLYLERCDPALNMARFYALTVSPTLFPGEWVLARRWGRIGQFGLTRESWFPSCDAALAAQTEFTARKVRRGYRPR